jgi:hypothetical protein
MSLEIPAITFDMGVVVAVHYDAAGRRNAVVQLKTRAAGSSRTGVSDTRRHQANAHTVGNGRGADEPVEEQSGESASGVICAGSSWEQPRLRDLVQPSQRRGDQLVRGSTYDDSFGQRSSHATKPDYTKIRRRVYRTSDLMDDTSDDNDDDDDHSTAGRYMSATQRSAHAHLPAGDAPPRAHHLAGSSENNSGGSNVESACSGTEDSGIGTRSAVVKLPLFQVRCAHTRTQPYKQKLAHAHRRPKFWADCVTTSHAQSTWPR